MSLVMVHAKNNVLKSKKQARWFNYGDNKWRYATRELIEHNTILSNWPLSFIYKAGY